MSKWTIGDFVVVKPGTRDPDLGGDIGGWQGRVVELDQSDEHPDLICIEWDSTTLRQMPATMIQQCEEQDMVWTLMWLDAHEVEETTPRDTSEDIARAQRDLVAQSDWFYLGEQGRRIQQVMEGVNEYDDRAAFRAWERYLKRHLAFPFAATISEVPEWGPLRAGDRLKALRVAGVEDPYGVLVRVQYAGRAFAFPLCDLKVADRGSPNYQFVDDYATWFANR